jgi:hypothetical protein
VFFRFCDHLFHFFVGMEVAIAAMIQVVNAAEEFRLCYRSRIRSLYRKRYLIPVEGLLDEDGNCAGHGENLLGTRPRKMSQKSVLGSSVTFF